jgi:hypothetical protein
MGPTRAVEERRGVQDVLMIDRQLTGMEPSDTLALGSLLLLVDHEGFLPHRRIKEVLSQAFFPFRQRHSDLSLVLKAYSPSSKEILCP